MRILYHMPSTETVYAGRTIYNGYRNAFIDLGHEFKTLTAEDNLVDILRSYQPEIFITSLHSFYLRFLDLKEISRARKRGLKVMVNIPFWQSPISRYRLNEASSLIGNREHIDLIRSSEFGDLYFNSVEQNDNRMDGFTKNTNCRYLTVPLAADKIVLDNARHLPKFSADISYIGTYLPEKRRFFKRQVFPLRSEYKLKLYGQDWTYLDRIVGMITRFGQYYSLKVLKSLQRPHLELHDEADIYASSVISINIHESYQRRFGGDANERTFKIPFCGGFEITDDVACIGRYLKDGEEIVIAKNRDDWFDKIRYYLKYPEKRLAIITAGRSKVAQKHTYHNRVKDLLRAASAGKSGK